MLNIIFIAPPAAGKGTLSSMIEDKYYIPHISMGDILREKMNENSDLSLLIKEKIALGEFIDDDVTIELMENRLLKDDIQNGYILDGFPRDINQAEKLEEMLTKINKNNKIAIFLNISKKDALNRILGRMICPNCHHVYNVTHSDMTPRLENICDICNSDLIKREDDNEKSFDKRFLNYMEETKPVLEYYKKMGILFEIDATDNPYDTFSLIENIINEVKND